MAFLELRPLDEVRGVILKHNKKIIYLNDDGFLSEAEYTSPLTKELLNLGINSGLFYHEYVDRVMYEKNISYMAQYERSGDDDEQ